MKCYIFQIVCRQSSSIFESSAPHAECCFNFQDRDGGNAVESNAKKMWLCLLAGLMTALIAAGCAGTKQAEPVETTPVQEGASAVDALPPSSMMMEETAASETHSAWRQRSARGACRKVAVPFASGPCSTGGCSAPGRCHLRLQCRRANRNGAPDHGCPETRRQSPRRLRPASGG